MIQLIEIRGGYLGVLALWEKKGKSLLYVDRNAGVCCSIRKTAFIFSICQALFCNK